MSRIALFCALTAVAFVAGCSRSEAASGAGDESGAVAAASNEQAGAAGSTAVAASQEANVVQVIKPGDRLPMPAVDIPLTESGEPREAVFAGGCFWCNEAVFEMIDGVLDVVSGYAGGDEATAKYNLVSTGTTKHAEAIRITYDPSKITYGGLLRIHFASHDPTQLNRQGPDVGPQYRTAIFYANEDELRVAKAYIEQLAAAEAFSRPIVTTLEPDTGFYDAEGYHQDFARRNPSQSYIRAIAQPKVEKFVEQYEDLLRSDAAGR